MLWRATLGVVEQRMTLGDLVMINAFMIQLYIPLNFLGVLYREIKQSLTDLDKMFTLMEKEREVADRPRAAAARRGLDRRFEDVHFAYEATGPSCTTSASRSRPARPWRWAGPSGSGKSTLAWLLYRFYDAAGPHHHRRAGRARGHPVQRPAGDRHRPQDTVLFNDTVEYNIA